MKDFDYKLSDKMMADSDSAAPNNFPWRMTKVERAFLQTHTDKSSVYFEFGSGGSTFNILKTNPEAKVISIDSSLEWIDVMKEYAFIKNAIEAGKLDLIHGNIGETVNWGRPKKGNDPEMFVNYYELIWGQISEKGKIDTILIDGCMRIQCSMALALEFRDNLRNITILMHDFTLRKSYQKILDYYEVVEQEGTLARLQLREDVDYDVLQKDYDKRRLRSS